MLKINPKKNFRKIFQFLKEVKLEMKKITWPSLRATLRYTGIVIVFSVAVAIFLGAVDFVFTFWLNNFIL